MRLFLPLLLFSIAAVLCVFAVRVIEFQPFDEITSVYSTIESCSCFGISNAQFSKLRYMVSCYISSIDLSDGIFIGSGCIRFIRISVTYELCADVIGFAVSHIQPSSTLIVIATISLQATVDTWHSCTQRTHTQKFC